MKNFEECKRETNAINAKLTRVTPDGQMYIASWFVIPARPPAARARSEAPSPDGTSAGR